MEHPLEITAYTFLEFSSRGDYGELFEGDAEFRALAADYFNERRLPKEEAQILQRWDSYGPIAEELKALPAFNDYLAHYGIRLA